MSKHWKHLNQNQIAASTPQLLQKWKSQMTLSTACCFLEHRRCTLDLQQPSWFGLRSLQTMLCGWRWDLQCANSHQIELMSFWVECDEDCVLCQLLLASQCFHIICPSRLKRAPETCKKEGEVWLECWLLSCCCLSHARFSCNEEGYTYQIVSAGVMLSECTYQLRFAKRWWQVLYLPVFVKSCNYILVCDCSQDRK